MDRRYPRSRRERRAYAQVPRGETTRHRIGVRLVSSGIGFIQNSSHMGAPSTNSIWELVRGAGIPANFGTCLSRRHSSTPPMMGIDRTILTKVSGTFQVMTRAASPRRTFRLDSQGVLGYVSARSRCCDRRRPNESFAFCFLLGRLSSSTEILNPRVHRICLRISSCRIDQHFI